MPIDFKHVVSRLEKEWYSILDPSKLSKEEYERGHVRDPIHGHIELAPPDFFILDIPPFQRLRAVSQLSFVDRIYPGANHSRFEHSLGAAYLAQRVMQNLSLTAPKNLFRIKPSNVWEVKIAAYLHDIGHLPFSHAIEPLFSEFVPPNDDRAPHEVIGHEIARSKYLFDVLDRINSEFKLGVDQQKIANLATGSRDQIRDEELFMYEIIHGKPIDCDRLDYLLRDAYYCGVPHGKVDAERLLETFNLVPRRKGVHLAVDVSGLLALEAMAVSRRTMYGAVYNHRTSRIVEGMILRAIHYEQQDKTTTLQSIIGSTDGQVMELLAKGSKIAKRLAVALRYRRFFKRIFEAKISEICDLKPNVDYQKALHTHGRAFAKANGEFKSWKNRLKFEESCFPRSKDKGSASVDCPVLKLPQHPAPDEYTPIRFPNGPPRSIVDVSPIVHSVEMEGDSYTTSILCAADHNVDKDKFQSNVKRSFKERFGIVIP
jgi:HD superfamily phosphohydrolase